MKFKTEKSRKTYERVLGTAIKLFKEKGYSHTTMRDISNESELGLGAIYYYFKSKEDIINAFYSRINTEIIEEYHSRFKKYKSFPKAIGDFMCLKIELLTPYRDLIQVIIKEAVDRNSPLSPFNQCTGEAQALSKGIFLEIAEKTNVKDPNEVAQQTWLFHLLLLGLWTQDRSSNFRMTYKMIENFKSFLKISLIASKIPGLGKLQKTVRQDLAELF